METYGEKLERLTGEINALHREIDKYYEEILLKCADAFGEHNLPEEQDYDKINRVMTNFIPLPNGFEIYNDTWHKVTHILIIYEPSEPHWSLKCQLFALPEGSKLKFEDIKDDYIRVQAACQARSKKDKLIMINHPDAESKVALIDFCEKLLAAK